MPRLLSRVPLVSVVAMAMLVAPVRGQDDIRGPSGIPIDLTHSFDESTVFWPTARAFDLEVESRGVNEAGWWYAANAFSAAEHGGTHLDAPIHFARGRRDVAEIPLEDLMGAAVVVDVREASEADPDHLVSRADLSRWEARHGAVPDRAIVLIRTGWGSRWPDPEAYLGTALRGPEAIARLHFPGLDPEAARWLVEERDVRAVGIDTASIDRGQSSDFLAHRVLADAEVPIFENVARLDRLPPIGAWVIALPMKIAGGTGAPLRLVAFVSEQ